LDIISRQLERNRHAITLHLAWLTCLASRAHSTGTHVCMKCLILTWLTCLVSRAQHGDAPLEARLLFPPSTPQQEVTQPTCFMAATLTWTEYSEILSWTVVSRLRPRSSVPPTATTVFYILSSHYDQILFWRHQDIYLIVLTTPTRLPGIRPRTKSLRSRQVVRHLNLVLIVQAPHHLLLQAPSCAHN
jgi:hypothetical protein